MDMKSTIKFIFIIVFLTAVACNQDDEKISINESEKLIGYWIHPEYSNLEIKLTRSNSLKNNEYGISFFEDGLCIERSAGWCGTPPLVYTDYRGAWSRNGSDLVVSIGSGINGMEDIKWEIRELDDEYLIIKRIPKN